MTDNQINKVAQILHDLEEDEGYKALTVADDDLHFNQFRGDVRKLRTRLFGANPAIEDIRHELKLLQSACFGGSSPHFDPT
jgi:hypothetical protein